MPAYSLPPQAEADMLMIEAKKLIDSQHYSEAAEKLKRVSELNVNVPDTFSFHYGIALVNSGNPAQGLIWLDKYISAAGSGGKFYKEALEAYSAAEKKGMRFSELSGNLLDNTTGLLWTQSDYYGEETETLLGSSNYCNSKGRGWRLPSLAEFRTIYDASYSAKCERGKSICRVSPQFILGDRWFWTSDRNNDGMALTIHLVDGSISPCNVDRDHGSWCDRSVLCVKK